MQVSAIGVGGYHLGSAEDENEAKRIVDAAIDAGINFFDNAWEYHEGRSEEWLGNALKGKRDRVVLMTKVCTHGRDKKIGDAACSKSRCGGCRRITWTSGRSTR